MLKPPGMGSDSAAKDLDKYVDANRESQGRVRRGDVARESYHRGGKVKRTGPANLEKGEVVLTAAQARQVKRRSKGRVRGRHRGRSKSR